MSKNAAIYARVSTSEQVKGFSIEAQLDAGRKFSGKHNWPVVAEYIDAGLSGTTADRPEFRRMIREALSGKFHIIIVHAFDRFSRNIEDAVVYKSLLRRDGIQIVSVTEQIDSSPMGFIHEGIIDLFAAYYSINLSAKIRSGLVRSIKNCRWPWAVPTGYEKQNGWVRIAEAGAGIKQAFEEFATNNYTLETWAEAAYRAGLRGPGGKKIWAGGWSRIFHNRFYLGRLVWNDLDVEGVHEPLVDECTFNKVQNILRENDQYAAPRKPGFYLLRGLCWSIDAGDIMSGALARGRGGQYRYYRSRGKIAGNGRHYTPCDVIEAQLEHVLSNVTISPQDVDTLPLDDPMKLVLRAAPNVGSIYQWLETDEQRQAWLKLVVARHGLSISGHQIVEVEPNPPFCFGFNLSQVEKAGVELDFVPLFFGCRGGNMKRLLLPLLLAPLFFVVFSVIALAQGPEDCVPITSTTFYLSDFVDAKQDTGVEYIPLPEHNIDYAVGISDTQTAILRGWADHYMYWSYSLPYIVSGTVIIDSIYTSQNVWEMRMHVHPNRNASVFDDGWVTAVPNFDGTYVGQVGSIRFAYKTGVFGGGYVWLDAAHIVVTGCYFPVAYDPCPTITDHHFTGAISDTWQLSGSAAITDSKLTLSSGDVVSQTIDTLTAFEEYSAVISVTSTYSSTNTPFYLSLISSSEYITLTGPGLYTATLTASSDTEIYTLAHVGPISGPQVEIDWTCLYLADDEEGERVCLAPSNGEFNTDGDWDWFYGAMWDPPSESALLPYNDVVSDTGRSLIVSTDVYSLPTLITNTYLILGFDSMAVGQNAVVASRVSDNWQEFTVPGQMYSYEADISSQAGLSATVSFANAGAPDGQFAAVDDALVDNVCIYVSDTPPQIPTPLNPVFDPYDFGFNYTCPDVPALLAGYGIDVVTPQAVYDAGVGIWEYQYWVPWLAGAVWNNAGSPVSCFLVEFMRLQVGLFTQVINNITNIVNWNWETTNAGADWLGDGLILVASARSGEGYWFNWFAVNARTSIYNGAMNAAVTDTRLQNIEAGLGDVPRRAQNTAAYFAGTVQQVVNLAVQAWNDSVIPYMTLTTGSSGVIPSEDPTVPTSPWWAVWDAFMWLIEMIGSIIELFWSLLTWLVNVLLAGATAPVEAYHSFVAGVESEAATVEAACVDSNFWCYFWAGVQMINQTISNTVIYTIVIVFMILASIVIVFYNLYSIFAINIS